MAFKPPRPGPRTKNDKEENIFNLVNKPSTSASPKIIIYNIAPTPTTDGPQPKIRMHSDSSQIENIFNPVKGPRDAQIRAGIKPSNHSRHNIGAVKEQSQMNALRKISEVPPQGAVTKLPPVRSTSAPSRRPVGLPAANAGGGPAFGRGASPGAGYAAGRQPCVDDYGRDFVSENRMGAAAPMRQQPARQTEKEKESNDALKYLQKRDFGRIPQYLLERKLEMAADLEAKERAKEAALIPPGMRVMPEEERLETLTVLRRNKEEVDRALQNLPLRIETPSQIRRKDDLEMRLKEIDDAFKVFSRPKVLVQL